VNPSFSALLKVPLSMQGRVFSTRMMLAWSSIPLAFLLAGPLADRVFEPLLQINGKLANTWISCIGVGPGRGTATLLMLNGILAMLFAVGCYFKPRFLHVEKDLPDTITARSSKIEDSTAFAARRPLWKSK
jgi:MFS transporter, DHA3 family, macrolide efflux protein